MPMHTNDTRAADQRLILSAQQADHLRKLLGYLGSDHDGERAAAARKAHEFIARLGLTWGDVIYSPPAVNQWAHIAAECAKHEQILSESERDFIANIQRRRRPPTAKQLAWLEAIHARLYHGADA
jgi:succinate dehydrogenase flavin-adding protein (antitoxin of CptAB toxin-antitoxin module)